jgi:hypothetical protein
MAFLTGNIPSTGSIIGDVRIEVSHGIISVSYIFGYLNEICQYAISSSSSTPQDQQMQRRGRRTEIEVGTSCAQSIPLCGSSTANVVAVLEISFN